VASNNIVYHAIDPADKLFCHNIAINAGKVTAVSLARLAHPEWSGMLSPYEAFTREGEKEKVFENVRLSEFDTCPPRLGSIFAFPTQEAAARCNDLWWQGKRVILEAAIIQVYRIGVFDSHHLNAQRESWLTNARKYWSAELSDAPSPEVIIEGTIILLGWEPYGLLFGGLGKS
jgi:hypothetical protein